MIVKTFRKVWDNFLHDPLFRNSIYLMLTTGVMGMFGFVFWTISTHIFSPADIGLGTTIISSMTMLSYVSLFGFNNTFIRFLPTSSNKNNEINAGTLIVVMASIILSIVYIILIPYTTPSLSIIGSTFIKSAIFILMVVAASLNSLTDSIFVAFRKAEYNLLTDGFIISIFKLILPVMLVGIGAYGVFMASGLSTLIGLVASFLILVYKFNYSPKIYFNLTETKKVLSYSLTSYLGSLLSIAPTLLLPIIIINHIGAENAGYFYLAFMVINLLYTVSSSVSQSLFAEGSYGESVLRPLLKRSIFILVLILIPASILLAFIGPMILELFGKTYSAGAGAVIVILALTSPVVALFNLGSTLLKIRQQMKSVVFINAIYAITICELTDLWVMKGLIWVAFAWIIGNLVAGILAFISLYMYKHLPTQPAKN